MIMKMHVPKPNQGSSSPQEAFANAHFVNVARKKGGKPRKKKGY